MTGKFVMLSWVVLSDPDTLTRPSGRPEMPTPRRPPRCEESMSGTVVSRPALCALHAGTCSPGRGACRDPALSGGLSRDSDFPPAPLRALSRCCVVLCARLLCARFYYYLGYNWWFTI